MPSAESFPEPRLKLLGRDGVAALQHRSAYKRGGFGGYGVGHHTAGHFQHIHRCMTRDQAGMVDSLFPVNQREVGVGAEAEEGSGVICVIVLQIPHAGLLVAAEQRTDRIAEREPGILQVLESIQAEHAGPLVVHHTSAEKEAFPLAQREGIRAPAVPGGNHVQMGDGGQIPLTVILTHRGIADLVFAVDGGQPEFLCDLQATVERPLGFDAEGGIRLGRTFDAGDTDEAGDVADDVALMVSSETVDVGKSVFVNGDGVHGEPPCMIMIGTERCHSVKWMWLLMWSMQKQ